MQKSLMTRQLGFGTGLLTSGPVAAIMYRCSEMNFDLGRRFSMRLTARPVGSAVLLMAILGINAAGALTYSEDIRPIFAERCVSCHRPGQIAPMSLLTYEEVRPWAKSIAREVTRKAMPPFHADGPLGRYVDDMRLTDSQIAEIVKWVETGAKRGSAKPNHSEADLVPDPNAGREPDFFIDFPKHVLPAADSESDPYVFLYSENVFEEDTWIAGYDWFFSNYRVVHHAAAKMIPGDDPTPPSGIAPKPLRSTTRPRGFASWFPGQGPIVFPRGTAKFVEKGTRILTTMHYSPTSEQTSDRPRIGVYLYSGELRSPFRYLSLSVRNEGLRIPPGASNHTVRVNVPMKSESVIHSFYTHMHYRGKSARLWQINPEGEDKLLFDIPRYSFDWQRTYELEEPLRIAEGTQFRAEFAWDNSEANPDNPDPAAEVTFGPSSFDEMGGIRIGIETIPKAKRKKEWPMIAEGRVVSGEVEKDWTQSEFTEALERLSDEDRKAAIAKALRRLSPEEREKLVVENLRDQTPR